ncbi:MAG: CARDB domain-containing protein [bacterium]|nr:CARDB domain-containing protein [bacterium]
MIKKFLPAFISFSLALALLLPLDFVQALEFKDVIEASLTEPIAVTTINAPISQSVVLKFRIQIKTSAPMEVVINSLVFKYTTGQYANDHNYFNSFKLHKLVAPGQLAEGPALSSANFVGGSITFYNDSSLSILEHGQYSDFALVADIKENIPSDKEISFTLSSIGGDIGFPIVNSSLISAASNPDVIKSVSSPNFIIKSSTSTLKPDLKVYSLTLENIENTANKYKVNYVMENVGAGAAVGSSFLTYYLNSSPVSKKYILSDGEKLLSQQKKTGSFELNYTPQDYKQKLKIELDRDEYNPASNNLVNESDETNNSAELDLPLAPAPEISDKPDFTVQSMTLTPENPKVNENVKIEVVYNNGGGIFASTYYNTLVNLGQFIGKFKFINSTQVISRPYPSVTNPWNNNEAIKETYEGAFLSAGQMILVASIDDLNKIEEKDENNNKLTKVITINNADLSTNVSLPKADKLPDLTNEDNNTFSGYIVVNDQFAQINSQVKSLLDDKMGTILSELKQLRDTVREQQTEVKYLKSLIQDVKKVSDKALNAINNFITYGVDANTVKLGEGERAAVIHSYKSAFNKLPETEAELADAIKIANGRWPGATNDQAEKRAKEQFRKIYKRITDMNNTKDNAAVTVMAYGLRQKAENRNLGSEKQGIITFQNIYGYHPATTEEWNIMQAITYSGATRGIDTDGDLLTDDREAELDTDPNNKDSDGDGYLDGVEVADGYDPKGPGKIGQ